MDSLGAARGLAVSLLAPAAPGRRLTQTLAQANQALQAGQADKALALLNSLPQGGADWPMPEPGMPRAAMLEQWNQAVTSASRQWSWMVRTPLTTMAGPRAGREGRHGLVPERVFPGQAGEDGI